MHSLAQLCVYDRRNSTFAVASHGKVECRAGKIANLLGGLFGWRYTSSTLARSVLVC